MSPTSLGRTIVRNALGLFCLAFLLWFHALNASEGELLAPFQRWAQAFQRSRIAFVTRSKTLFGFPFVAYVEPKSRRRKRGARPELDAAQRWLSWSGIYLRTLVGQSQPRWINYPYRGKRYYFLRDEIVFQYQREEQNVEVAFGEVERLMDEAVSAAGGTLVITPMPTKTSIYRERLPKWLPEQTLFDPVVPYDRAENAYGVYSPALAGDRTATVDVFRAFARHHREHPDDELYVPSNHEWSSLGIATTSAGVIENLRRRGWALAAPKVVRLPVEGELYDAGLLDILNLPPAFAGFYPQTALREIVYGVEPVVERTSRDRLILFGTCYSNRLRDSNGFANTLAHALRRTDVTNMGADGGKTLPGIERFAAKHRRFMRGDLVVWEFNVRETFTRADVRRIKAALAKMSRRR
jgi:hypothetical protein